MSGIAPQADEPRKGPSGISMADLRTVDVSVEVPGSYDPVTGEPAVITYTCERLDTGRASRFDAVKNDLEAEGAESEAVILAQLAELVTDVRGLADFARRGAREAVEAFRERFVAYFREAGPAAALVYMTAVSHYLELQQPRPSFRSFPR